MIKKQKINQRNIVIIAKTKKKYPVEIEIEVCGGVLWADIPLKNIKKEKLYVSKL